MAPRRPPDLHGGGTTTVFVQVSDTSSLEWDNVCRDPLPRVTDGVLCFFVDGPRHSQEVLISVNNVISIEIQTTKDK